MASCADCREELGRSRALAAALAGFAAAPSGLPAGLEAATLRRMRQAAAEEVERRGGGMRWLRWFGVAVPALAAAAVVVLAVGLARRTASVPGAASPAVPVSAPPADGPARLAKETSGTRRAAPAERRAEPEDRDVAAQQPSAPDAGSRLARAPGDEIAAGGAGAGGADGRVAAAAGTLELPPELLERPDLFVELPILKHMEKLQNFDSIQTTTVNGARDPASNG